MFCVTINSIFYFMIIDIYLQADDTIKTRLFSSNNFKYTSLLMHPKQNSINFFNNRTNPSRFTYSTHLNA